MWASTDNFSVSVGTPPQILTVLLDTGSSDLYVDAASAEACQDPSASNSCRGGIFDPTASQTYNLVGPGNFSTAFGDGSAVSGDFATDVVGVGAVELTNVQFGVANFINSTTGYAISLMGVGYSANEASAPSYYPNMPDLLQQAGAINSRLYSIFLNQYGMRSHSMFPPGGYADCFSGQDTGSILFGGIDTSLYTGKLHTLNIMPTAITDPSATIPEAVSEFLVQVSGISMTSNGKTAPVLSYNLTEYPILFLLDTGSADWTVPREYYNAIMSVFGSTVDQNQNMFCSDQNDTVSLDIEFGGEVTINVPAKNFVVPLIDSTTNAPVTSDGKAVCTVMLSPDDGTATSLILGDAILRSMYVVFDLDNGQVSIAQANTNPGSSNVVIVPAGANGIATAVGESGVEVASENVYSIAPEVTATETINLMTASAAVGTATGTDAVPQEGQVVTGSGSSSPSASGYVQSAAMTIRSDGRFTSLGAMAALWGIVALLNVGW